MAKKVQNISFRNMWIGNQTPGNGSGAHSFSFNIGTSSSATRTVAFKFVP